MKHLVISLSLLAITSLAFAAEEASVVKGMELFKSPQLGTNGTTCNTCHPDGKGLTKAATYDEKKLSGIINTCIKAPLAGKTLDLNSTEMKSLVLYIKSLVPAPPRY